MIQTFFKSCKYQCRLCKRFNVQHCLVSMTEKWKEIVDSSGVFAILMPDEKLIAKLDAYGFDLKSMRLVQQKTFLIENRRKTMHIAHGKRSIMVFFRV